MPEQKRRPAHLAKPLSESVVEVYEPHTPVVKSIAPPVQDEALKSLVAPTPLEAISPVDQHLLPLPPVAKSEVKPAQHGGVKDNHQAQLLAQSVQENHTHKLVIKKARRYLTEGRPVLEVVRFLGEGDPFLYDKHKS